MIFLRQLEHFAQRWPLPLAAILTKFYQSYKEAVTCNGHSIEEYEPLLLQFLEQVNQQIHHPYLFQPYHERVRHPFDYYQFGLEMMKPLVIFPDSFCLGLDVLNNMMAQLKRGDNVILFSNHQTEPDPQAISLLLEMCGDPRYVQLAEEMIFVAGHRVITDPLAVPFSLGRNLLCIFSKKYIQVDPATKQEKMQHNQRTMKIMAQLLSEGGKCIYVAPSGGRDRPNAQGKVEVAPFDSQSIEMFTLMAEQSGRPAHFYPFALSTYSLLPPPNSVEAEIGEKRQAQCTPISLAFGQEIDLHNIVETTLEDKKQRRSARAEAIWKQVKELYTEIHRKI